MKRFVFVAGNDEFLVEHHGQAWHKRAIAESGCVEIVNGQAQTVAEVGTIIKRFLEAVQVLPLFSEKQAVWFRGINFLGDSVTARSESTKEQVATLLEALDAIDPNAVSVLLTAFPADRRTREYKRLFEQGESMYLENTPVTAYDFLKIHCEHARIGISQDVAETLLGKVGGQLRAAIQEIDKLATYLEPGTTLSHEHIASLVPQLGESDFFEFTEAFFSQNLTGSLEALDRYFFHNKEVRPLLSSLQNRNRLLIQLRALSDSRALSSVSQQSLTKLRSEYPYFPESLEKTSFAIFTQNPWYLGRLQKEANNFSLRQLVDHQLAFIEVFENILAQPEQAKELMRGLTMSLLAI